MSVSFKNLIKNFEKKAEKIKEKIKQEYPEIAEIIEQDFEITVTETKDELAKELAELDENCKTCRKIAEKIVNNEIEVIKTKAQCYSRCYNYFKQLLDDEVEPPCTSFCPILQNLKQLEFNFHGHMHWFCNTPHEPHCKFSSC